MNTIIEQFAKMGARAKVRLGNALSLDVLKDKEGEYFDIQTRDAEIAVLNVDKPGRHLLLQTRQNNDGGSLVTKKPNFSTQKFLCGHDERHWFVATVDPGAGTVEKAKQSLKPRLVRDEEGRKGVAKSKKHRHHNEAFYRQGEWFFMSQGSWKPPEKAIILKHEPFTRGGGSKNHYAEFAYRSGGESVWVNSEYPNGIDDKTYQRLMKEAGPESRKPGRVFRNMRRGAAMYVKGKISHADHKTIILKEWCLVVMNKEERSETVAFLD